MVVPFANFAEIVSHNCSQGMRCNSTKASATNVEVAPESIKNRIGILLSVSVPKKDIGDGT